MTTFRSVRGFSLSTASELTGLHPEFIEEILRASFVHAADPAGTVFDERGLCRLRQIADLHHRQGLNLRTVKLIVDLLDRLEDAEVELRALRERIEVMTD